MKRASPSRGTPRLVILGSTITALAVAREAHALGLAPVIVDSEEGIAFHSRWVYGRLLEPAAVLDGIRALLEEAGRDSCHVIATGDPWVRFVRAHRAQLEPRTGAILHPDDASLDICLDKARFARWCEERGFSAPVTWSVSEESRPEGLTAPFLIRPATTLHGRNTHALPKAVEAASEPDLEAWLGKFAEAGCPALVSQSLLGGGVTQYSVPFSRGPHGIVSFVARKVRPGPEHCAVGTLVELAQHAEAEALARRAAEALGYFGVGEAEVLHVAATRRCYLIEINARPWLQFALAPASGHDFLGPLVGRPRSLRPVKRGRTWVDLYSDLYVAFSSSHGVVRRGQLGIVPYCASLLRANVYARFDWRDPGPALRLTAA